VAWTDILDKVVHTEKIDPVHSHPADGGILGDLKGPEPFLFVNHDWIYSRRMLFLSYFLQLKSQPVLVIMSSQLDFVT
jgi:hypothetical protein